MKLIAIVNRIALTLKKIPNISNYSIVNCFILFFNLKRIVIPLFASSFVFFLVHYILHLSLCFAFQDSNFPLLYAVKNIDFFKNGSLLYSLKSVMKF